MRLLPLLLLLVYAVAAKRWKQPGGKRDSCAERAASKINDTSPVHVSSATCCDSRLESLLRSFSGTGDERLGDTARMLQKMIQNSLGHSVEVIMSKGDFSLSTHYHGKKICKVRVGGKKRRQTDDEGYHILAYETPVNYNVDDLPEESRMAAIDAQEDLGSTPEDDRGHFPDARMDPLAGEDTSMQPSPQTSRAAFFLSKFGNNTSHRQGEDLNEGESRIPEGATCSRERAGNVCCSGAMYETMERVLDELSSSPDFDDNEKSPGIAANLVKKEIQQKFGRVFEVVVSNSDFEHASHQVGDLRCKFQSHGLFLMAYETPHQSAYDPFAETEEEHFSSISNPDPLGTPDLNLPKQRETSKSLELENEGDRAGFPKGSHCDSGERLGSVCCSLGLFNAMYTAVQQLQENGIFRQLDEREIASQLRTAAEKATAKPMEAIISMDDFVVSSHGSGNNKCKFRVNKYFVMAWETPSGDYGIGEEQYADNGFTTKVGCGGNTGAIQGASCCSGELRYAITKAVDDTTNHQRTKADADAVAKAMVNTAQSRFNVQMDTVVSRGDFVWLRADGSLSSPLTCKLDLFQFHTLTFQSGSGTSQTSEFAGTGELASVQCADCVPQSPSVLENVVLPQPPIQQAIPPQFQPIQPLAQPIQPIPLQIQVAPQLSPQLVQEVPPIPTTASFCFSEDTWVTTPTGKKNMAMLQLGDYVLTANLTHKYFAPVTVWMHRDPEKYAHFYTIMTEYGKMLRITAKHLIFRNKCGDNFKEYIKELPKNEEAVFAHELVKDDCVILLYSGKWRQQKIKEITRTKRKGIYAPLTSNGRILVNDILASCYSDVKGSTIQTTYFQAISLMREAYYDLTGWLAEKKIELPFSTDILKDVLSIILPN